MSRPAILRGRQARASRRFSAVDQRLNSSFRSRPRCWSELATRGQWGAQTVVRAVAVPQLALGLASDVEAAGIRVSAWVAVGGVYRAQFRTGLASYGLEPSTQPCSRASLVSC